LVWVLAAAAVYRFGPPKLQAQAWSWGTATVVGWAGMRGVVTLAAVYLLPASTPDLNLIQLCAFTVVAGTLAIQGTTLPWLVRRLHLPAPDAAADALQAASLVTDAARAGLDRLEQVRSPDDTPEVVDALRYRVTRRINTAWERLGRPQDEVEPPSAAYRRLRVKMLDAERQSILAARDSGTVDDQVLRAALQAVDVEESILDPVDDVRGSGERELVAPERRTGDCEHLRAAPTSLVPNTPGACEDCLREGTHWVHLRLCLICAHVGCCDSSPRRHASAHFHGTGHPVMRSIEPGEAWRWCYVDDILG
jgi:CPA1 family monovalent cation:H+ antiporter